MATTLNLQVAASTDDATQRETTFNFDAANALIILGSSAPPQGRWAGFGFVLTADIPSGATIEPSYLSFPSIVNTTSDNINARIYAHKISDAPTFSSGVGTDVVQRTLTTASVLWNASDIVADENSPDISSVIQELVDAYGGLSSGARIALIVAHVGTTEELRLNSYEGGAANGAELSLSFSTASSNLAVMQQLRRR